MVITKEMIKDLPFLTEDDFDLSKYLDTIPYEELKNQYEDYSSYDIINGFDTLPEDEDEPMKKVDEEAAPSQDDTMSIEEAKERTLESVRKIYEENGNL